MEIVMNVVREKIRKKMLYITTILGIMVVALFSSDMGSITIGGKNIKDYYILVPILINVVNVISGAVALAISVTTVPNEYERHTSHLIWSRGVSQSRYHMLLAIGNVVVSWISGFVLYLTLGIFAVLNNYQNILGTIIISILFMMIYTAIISMMATALTIKIPAGFTIVIMILILVGGALRSVLKLLVAAMTGVGGVIAKRVLMLIPNLAEISTQAGNLIQGKPVSTHEVVMGLFIIWLAGLCILLFKREEA